MRNNIPALPPAPAAVPAPEAPPASIAPQPAAPASLPSPAIEAETRQERDRRAFVVCRERATGAGPRGTETVAGCLRNYSNTGVVPGD